MSLPISPKEAEQSFVTHLINTINSNLRKQEFVFLTQYIEPKFIIEVIKIFEQTGWKIRLTPHDLTFRANSDKTVFSSQTRFAIEDILLQLVSANQATIIHSLTINEKAELDKYFDQRGYLIEYSPPDLFKVTNK